MILTYRELGKIIVALVVAVSYWGYGAVLLLAFFALSVSTLNFVWLGLFRLFFYLPAIVVVIYLFHFRKNKGLFLESLMFFLALSLAVLWTLELIIFI